MTIRLRERIQSARRRAASDGSGGNVLDCLVKEHQGPLDTLWAALRAEAGVVPLPDGTAVEPAFDRLDKAAACRLNALPLRMGGDERLHVAMADPWDRERVRELAGLMGSMPILAAAPAALLARHLGAGDLGAGSSTSDGELRTARVPVAVMPTDGGTGVVGFVDAALRSAFDGGASDVHFECDRMGVSARLRVDGVMVQHARLEGVDRAEEVISRIKVLAQLDITERRTPQDGRFRLELGAAGSVDLRVSIMPSVFGEDAVLRLLDKAQLRDRQGGITLGLLGFDAASTEHLRDLAELPHGMLMVTGPTGSGKTTTVYALLSEISTGLEKIVTIEDPVEYELPGVLQIPVNERKGLTFAKGLRSILRHDPDRILVGEIRDAETAEIAVQSALTGHQVYTTVHANSIFDVTGRFRHFGLDMFGFMSSLNGVVVQRLVRTLCPHCAGHRAPAERERRWLDAQGLVLPSVPVAQGCEACRGSGYRGRKVLAEVHRIDDGYRDLVIRGSQVSDLRAHVQASGVQTLAARAASLVQAGQTTLEEVKRVVGW